MKNTDAKKGGGLFRKLKTRLSNGENRDAQTVPLGDSATASQEQLIMEEYSSIKQNPDKLTGWDFDRAFDFLEKYPDSDYVEKLKEEMYGTNSESLKGLTYSSAVKILQSMPEHRGVPSILNGMRKVESDYIRELKSDIIAYMLEVIPDHPLMNELAKALAEKNLTNAYDFVERNIDHPCTRVVIKAMFERDANIATLLLHERMDHPHVDAIFEGIYSIGPEAVAKMMPDAIIFILEVATDHRYAQQLLEALVEKNYIKAFDFVMNNPEHALAGRLAELIGKRKPELIPLIKKKV
jgi:hypothetical protein